MTRELAPWSLTYEGWSADEQPLREALCTLGNGYFATRGAAEEASAGGCHYPGTYFAGGYNRLETEIAGRRVENESLVNWPNWLCLTFRPSGGPWFHPESVELLGYRQELDLHQGLLIRRVRFRDRDDRESELVSRRLVHMADAHLGAIEWTLTPLNWSGEIEIRSAIDGDVRNAGVARYRDLEDRHLEVLETSAAGEDALLLCARTVQSHLVAALAARTRPFTAEGPATAERRTSCDAAIAAQTLRVRCIEMQPLRVEKVVALHTSRDSASSEPRLEARKRVRRSPGFAELLRSHRLAWRRLWKRADLQIRGEDRDAPAILRLHIFHLLQTTSPHTIDLDAGVPARGLHGEAYRGHIFWDELFIFPFLDLHMPQLTRTLLMYRYRRLPEARHAARAAGYAGAMYPWQSGSNGREESQLVHLNPASGRWIPDETHRQRHIGAAIVHNIWHHYESTGDMEFLSLYGAEMILEIARFWASLAELSPERERYEIRDVVGPDEFHTHDPGSDSLGLRNNAYTNVMAAWCLRCALCLLDLLAEDRRTELLEQLELGAEELDRWDHVSRRMFVPFGESGILEQFEGFFELEEPDWQGLRRRHGDIQRLDRVLEAEGDDVNRYRACKQADALMLFYLFSTEELGALFERLGYRFEPDAIPKTIEYYLRHTAHGSTLSHIVHAWVTARSMRERSWHLFKEALASDVEDLQGGTTPEGIHLGAMAGTVDLIQRCYSGVETRDGVLWLNPRLPQGLEELCLCIRYRGHWLKLQITHEEVRVTFERGWPRPARVGFRDTVYEMEQGTERIFSL